jgi:hypothetical protein
MNDSMPRTQVRPDVGDWITGDTQVARRTGDTGQDDDATASASHRQPASRTVTYTGATVSIELSVENGAVLGHLLPPQPGTLVAREHGRTSIVQVDGLGHFALDPAPEAPFRLQLSGEVAVTTDWVELRGDETRQGAASG